MVNRRMETSAADRRKISLYKQIKLDILNSIVKNGLTPHTKLPSEGELAKTYSVSKMVGKMALDSLEDDGLIYRKPRSGSYVSEKEFSLGENAPAEPEKEVTRTAVSDKKLVGVIMPWLDPYCAEIVSSLQRHLGDLGYNMSLKVTDGLLSLEEKALVEFSSSVHISGIILFPASRRFCGDEIIRLQLERYPLVLIDNVFLELSLDSVTHNHYMGAYEMTNYLIDKGHKNICFLTADISTSQSRRERVRGFRHASLDRDIVFNKNMVQEFSIDDQRDEYKVFLQNLGDFTAVFCSHDYIAAQLLYTSLEMNIKVPESLSLAGFTDNELLKFLPIGITTVRQPVNRFCREVANLLTRRMLDPGKRIESLVIDTEIVERDSVRALQYTK